MTYSMGHAPETLCILRLSALGDITHVLPTLRTLQEHWPRTKIYWIIGKTEHQLVKNIEGVEFIIFDKSAGLKSYFRLKNDIQQLLGNKRFDVLLHMQLSLRASVASLFIPAEIKLGFDRQRAKDLQSLFCNQYIISQSTRQHVLDSFLEFPKHFSLEPVFKWALPISEKAVVSIKSKLQSDKKLFVINACAVAKAKNWRNWTVEGYAATADFVTKNHGMQVVLCGGNSELEVDTANLILDRCQQAKPINMVASTTIDEMVALLHIADIVLAPDTGPVHIASALNTKTIGLYASTNPKRAGPYNHIDNVVSRYPQALLEYNNNTMAQAAWGERIKTADAMRLISIEDVITQIEKIL